MYVISMNTTQNYQEKKKRRKKLSEINSIDPHPIIHTHKENKQARININLNVSQEEAFTDKVFHIFQGFLKTSHTTSIQCQLHMFTKHPCICWLSENFFLVPLNFNNHIRFLYYKVILQTFCWTLKPKSITSCCVCVLVKQWISLWGFQQSDNMAAARSGESSDINLECLRVLHVSFWI